MRTLRFLSCYSAAIFSLATCSPARIAIDKAEMSRLQTAPAIHAITYSPTPFSFISATDLATMAVAAGAVGALTGGLGGLFVGMHAESRARSRGEEMTRTYSLQDPGPRVRDAFVASAASRINLTNVFAVPESLPSDDLKAIEEKVGQITVLDFKTDNWQLMPGTLGAGYKMIYGVRSRLLSLADRKTLWQGYCVFDDANSPVTLEELTANGGVLLRNKVDEAAAFCAQTLVEQLLTTQN
jgi:hypothetical protein